VHLSPEGAAQRPRSPGLQSPPPQFSHDVMFVVDE
jgi:hypothetical protein